MACMSIIYYLLKLFLPFEMCNLHQRCCTYSWSQQHTCVRASSSARLLMCVYFFFLFTFSFLQVYFYFGLQFFIYRLQLQSQVSTRQSRHIYRVKWLHHVGGLTIEQQSYGIRGVVKVTGVMQNPRLKNFSRSNRTVYSNHLVWWVFNHPSLCTLRSVAELFTSRRCFSIAMASTSAASITAPTASRPYRVPHQPYRFELLLLAYDDKTRTSKNANTVNIYAHTMHTPNTSPAWLQHRVVKMHPQSCYSTTSRLDIHA